MLQFMFGLHGWMKRLLDIGLPYLINVNETQCWPTRALTGSTACRGEPACTQTKAGPNFDRAFG
jgi:hypothetical protein